MLFAATFLHSRSGTLAYRCSNGSLPGWVVGQYFQQPTCTLAEIALSINQAAFQYLACETFDLPRAGGFGYFLI